MAKAGKIKKGNLYLDTKQKMRNYTLERRVQSYPAPLYLRFVHALADHSGSSVSDVVSDAIKNLYESIDPKERSRIMEEYQVRQKINRQSKNSY